MCKILKFLLLITSLFLLFHFPALMQEEEFVFSVVQETLKILRDSAID